MNYLRLTTFLFGAFWISKQTAFTRCMEEGELSRTVFFILSIFVSLIVFITERRVFRSKLLYLFAFFPVAIYGLCSWGLSTTGGMGGCLNYHSEPVKPPSLSGSL
jgi:hypothetical protein